MKNRKEKEWEFIESFLPNYSSREDVALYNDLYKIVYKEHEVGDEAHELLEEYYEGDVDNPKIKRDLKELEKIMFLEALNNFKK